MVYIVLALIVIALMANVRFARSDPEKWHRGSALEALESKRLKGGYIWRQPLEDDGKTLLQALVWAAEATPRTVHLAGSVEDGKITYVTRSAIGGFPDYTTMGLYTAPNGTRYIEIYGRLRFGRSDLGVNAKRIKSWLDAAQL